MEADINEVRVASCCLLFEYLLVIKSNYYSPSHSDKMMVVAQGLGIYGHDQS